MFVILRACWEPKWKAEPSALCSAVRVFVFPACRWHWCRSKCIPLKTSIPSRTPQKRNFEWQTSANLATWICIQSQGHGGGEGKRDTSAICREDWYILALGRGYGGNSWTFVVSDRALKEKSISKHTAYVSDLKNGDNPHKTHKLVVFSPVSDFKLFFSDNVDDIRCIYLLN